MPHGYVISVDGACSGKRAACAAVLSIDGSIVAERSWSLPEVDGYVLAAEIAGVALASELLGDDPIPSKITIEVDNPDVPRVILEGYEPKQYSRIPETLIDAATSFTSAVDCEFDVLPRNSTAGLRRADSLAGKRLWRKL